MIERVSIPSFSLCSLSGHIVPCDNPEPRVHSSGSDVWLEMGLFFSGVDSYTVMRMDRKYVSEFCQKVLHSFTLHLSKSTLESPL